MEGGIVLVADYSDDKKERQKSLKSYEFQSFLYLNSRNLRYFKFIKWPQQSSLWPLLYGTTRFMKWILMANICLYEDPKSFKLVLQINMTIRKQMFQTKSGGASSHVCLEPEMQIKQKFFGKNNISWYKKVPVSKADHFLNSWPDQGLVSTINGYRSVMLKLPVVSLYFVN